MTLNKVVLMPHPPIALPEIARERFSDVEKTAKGMTDLAKDILKLSPDLLIIITPHSTLHPDGFVTFMTERLTGDFSKFGAPNVSMSLHNDVAFIETLAKKRMENGHKDILFMKETATIDHGSGVPLYYLLKEGYQGKVVIFNYSLGSTDKHKDFGKSLAEVVEELDRSAVLISSGDLSHRITPSAPAGYHPQGKDFDQLIQEAVKTGSYDDIIAMSQELRENAGECGFNSLMVAFGALNDKIKDNKIYSYEAPFGVGYLVASL